MNNVCIKFINIRFKYLSILVFSFIFASIATPSLSQEQIQWIGISDSVVESSIGIIKLNAQCNTKFKDSQMCTTKDIINTTETPPSLPSGGIAWVQPIHAGGFQDSNGESIIVEKYTGFTIPSSVTFNCKQWSSQGSNSNALVLILKEPGEFGTTNCVNEAFVACCAPKSK